MFTDLIGYKTGYLTVIRFDHKDKYGRQYWLCHCNACNSNTIKRRDVILSGKIIACGCMAGRNRNSDVDARNAYDLVGEYGIGYTSKNERFIFDLEDYDTIKNYCWMINDSGYVVANYNHTKIFLHRIVMNVTNGLLVDHINHNKRDNRKDNLRLVTNSQNQMNTVLRQHSAPYKGVSWHRQNKRWIAQIGINNELIYLGSFKNVEDAIRIRKEAEDNYFGEYAYMSNL